MNHFVLSCSGPGAAAAIAASERYAVAASLVSIPLLVVAAAIFSFARGSVRGACLNLMPLMIHPIWSISARGGDCGIILRSASTIWVALSLVLVFNALAAMRRHGAGGTHTTLQFTLRSLLACGLLAALVVAVSRSPLVGYLPLLGLLAVTTAAIWPVSIRRSTAALPPRVDTAIKIIDNTDQHAR